MSHFLFGNGNKSVAILVGAWTWSERKGGIQVFHHQRVLDLRSYAQQPYRFVLDALGVDDAREAATRGNESLHSRFGRNRAPSNSLLGFGPP